MLRSIGSNMYCRRQWTREFSLSSIIVYRTSASCKLRGCYGSRLELFYMSWHFGDGTSSHLCFPPAPSSGLRAALLCPPLQRSLWSPGKIPAALCDSNWSPDSPPQCLAELQGWLRQTPWPRLLPTGWRSRSDLLGRWGGEKSVGLFRTAPAVLWTGCRPGRGRHEHICSKREWPPHPRLSRVRCVPSRRPSCYQVLPPVPSSSFRSGRTKTPPGHVRKS